MDNDVRSMLSRVLELDEEEINEEIVLEELEEWDSLSKLTLMAEVKKQYQMKLTQDNMRAFVTVGDICRYIAGMKNDR